MQAVDWNKYIRIPFKEKGRDFSGCDCWGLVRLIMKEECGIELPSYLECYNSTEEREILSKTIQQEREAWDCFNYAPDNDVSQPFDVVILNLVGLPVHCGLVTSKGNMIHCAKDINTVRENYTGLRWKNKVVGFSRWKKL